MSKIKEINLIPSYAAFDYKLYLGKRIAGFLLVLNLIVLLVLYGVGIYFNMNLKRSLKKEKTYLSTVEDIDSSLNKYKDTYGKLIKRLKELKEKENYIRSIIPIKPSSFTNSVVFLNTFSEGIYFGKASYDDGFFEIEGVADSSYSFSKFYMVLERNRYIKKLRFFYIKRKDEMYMFKVRYKIEY